jgi:hypothetical protein
MNRKFYILALLFAGQQAMAQTPDDALRMSWNQNSGSARSQAIGGATGSLGGEITSLFSNPAGLGFFKTSEFVITPGLNLLKSKSSFRGTDASSDQMNRFNLGTTGFVFGWGDPYSKWKNKAFSIGVNRMANFNSRVHYKGQNDFSSFSEAFAEEFSRSGYPIDVGTTDANLTLGTKLGVYTYLIDTLTVNGHTEVVGLPQRDAILSGTDALLDQEKDITTKGGITEVAIGFAANMDDKIYFGGSIGVPIVNYERTSILTESDASGLKNNNFNYAKYQEDYTSKGVGINARLGMIFKPVEYVRLGVTIQTPSLYALKETTTGRLEADLENYFPPGQNIRVANTDTIYSRYGAKVPQYKYDLTTPWKFIVGGAYVIREVEDVSRQRGFISADVEYVSHKSSKFRSAEENDDDSYYDDVNKATKELYKGTFNFRVGGELKFNTIMARLGFAYYGNPYKDDEIKAHRMNVSGGLGYRDKGIFIDLTYVQSMNKDANFPYRLADKANTYAEVKENYGSMLLTFGIKL